MSDSRHIDEILKKIERLPTMSRSVVEIIRCLDDENASIDALVRQVSNDIGLATGILKMANTHRFSMHGGIASVHDAVMLIGFKQIREMACMVGLMDNFPKNKSIVFDYANFWRHSIGVGVCASELAKHVISKQHGLNPDVAFISGMLHDIGQLAVAVAVPDEYRAVIEYRASRDCTLTEAEEAVLGMDYAQIGAHLARKWEFPQIICTAIEKHHDPDAPPTSSMSDLVHIADVLCHALELGSYGKFIPPLSDYAMFRLNINFQQVSPWFEQIECEYRNVTMMLE